MYAGNSGIDDSLGQNLGGFIAMTAGRGSLGGDVFITAGTSVDVITGGAVQISGGSGGPNVGNVTINSFVFNFNNKTQLFPLATLSQLGIAGTAGRRAMINNSTVSASGNFGAIAVAGGSNVVPVFSNGVNWLIG